MDKLTAWIVTVIGVLLLLPLIGVDALASFDEWVIGLGVLAIGVKMLMGK